MNEGNAIIVVLIVIAILVGANGMMFLAVRGFTRGDKTTQKFFDSTRDTQSQPYQKENKSLEELRKRVENLKEEK